MLKQAHYAPCSAPRRDGPCYRAIAMMILESSFAVRGVKPKIAIGVKRHKLRRSISPSPAKTFWHAPVTKMRSHLPIFIAGGGIGGLTAAIILAQNGLDVHIFEQSGEFSEIGAGLQLSPNAMQIFEAIKLSGEISAVGFEPDFAALRHYQTGRPYLKTALKSICRSRYGAPYIHIHRADLQQVLLGAAKSAGVTFHMNACVKGYEQSPEDITLQTDKSSFKGRLVIGADGIKSAISTQISAEKDSLHTPRFTGQIAWRGIIQASALPSGLLPLAANVWMGPGKHFVAYYLRGGTLINFIVVEERDDWTDENWSLKGEPSKLITAFKGWDAPVTALIEACKTPYIWGLFDRPPCEHWQDGRAVLLGDAAHPMLPFMAQGAAMAIEDAWVLSHKILTAQSSDNNLLKALGQYADSRRPRTAHLQKISRSNAKMFHESRPAAKLFRGAKLSLAQSIPALQHMKLGPIYGVNVVNNYPIKISRPL